MAEPPLIEYPIRVAAASAGSCAGASLRLFRGESIGISGASGVGKTTLLEAIAGASLTSPGHGRIAYLPQNPRDLFPSHLATEFVVDAFGREQIDGSAYQKRCRRFLERLRLDPDTILRASSDSLSGGEIQRAAIAILLATEPDALLADEPTASLDVAAMAALAALFSSLKESRGLALLITSHDAGLLDSECDQILQLVEGALVPQSSNGRAGPAPILDKGISTGPLAEIAITRHELRTSPGGRRRALLQGFQQSFHGGLVYGLSGPSGVGKSTLLRMIAGHERPTHGLVKRSRGSAPSPPAILTPQDARQFFDPRRSIEAYSQLLEARIGRRLQRRDLVALLARLELRDPALMKRKPDEVSGGEAQRLALSITLWLGPRLMCLDEIDTGVPEVLKVLVGQTIRQHVISSERAAVVVSHDLAFLSSICDHLITLEL